MRIARIPLKYFAFACLLFALAAFSGCGPATKEKPETTEATGGLQLPDILKTLQPQETPELLLLGLNFDSGEGPYTEPDSALVAREYAHGYRTLLLRYENGQVTLAGDLPYLATPQPSGFYFIGNKAETWTEFSDETYDDGYRERSETAFDDHFFVIKPSAKELLQELKKPGQQKSQELPDCPDCEEPARDFYASTATTITYLIPGFATVNSWGENYTGGAHGNRFDHNNTVAFKSLLNPKAKSAELPVNFSEAKWDTIKRSLYFRGIAGLFIDGGLDENRVEPFRLSDYARSEIGKAPGNYQVDPENRDYVLYHQQGLVQLAIRAHADADYASSGDYKLTTEYEAGPLRIPGFPNSLPFRFADLAQTDTTITDCFLSPKQNVLFLTRSGFKKGQPGNVRRELVAIDVRTGKILFQKRIHGQVMMAEWATGKSVDRWQQQLKP